MICISLGFNSPSLWIRSRIAAFLSRRNWPMVSHKMCLWEALDVSLKNGKCQWMDTSPLTLTCCLVLGFTPSFAPSCFVVSVYNKLNNLLRLLCYNKLNNLLRAGYCWHHVFSTTTAGTWTVFTVSLQQRHSNTLLPTWCIAICKLHGHRVLVNYFISFIFITCCKRDRGGKCTS